LYKQIKEVMLHTAACPELQKFCHKILHFLPPIMLATRAFSRVTKATFTKAGLPASMTVLSALICAAIRPPALFYPLLAGGTPNITTGLLCHKAKRFLLYHKSFCAVLIV